VRVRTAILPSLWHDIGTGFGQQFEPETLRIYCQMNVDSEFKDILGD